MLRKQLAWTQAQAAREIGVASNTVARWERDELAIGEPEARLLRLLATKFGTKRRPR
jgi:transcriptional regulator with XRE-family HTH domain